MHIHLLFFVIYVIIEKEINYRNYMDLKDKAQKIINAKVLVIGDLMLDRFTYGDVIRISPEAPVPVLHVNHEENYLGGAGNVARNMAALLGNNNNDNILKIGRAHV